MNAFSSIRLIIYCNFPPLFVEPQVLNTVENNKWDRNRIGRLAVYSVSFPKSFLAHSQTEAVHNNEKQQKQII